MKAAFKPFNLFLSNKEFDNLQGFRSASHLEITPIQSGLLLKMIKSAFAIVLLFVCFNANAQTPMPTSVLKGPVKGVVNGAHLFITAEVRAGDSPSITFSLTNNYSGASIVSQGTFSYDNTTGIGTQIVEINPGNTVGSFIVKSETTNPKDTAESSMSVTVLPQ